MFNFLQSFTPSFTQAWTLLGIAITLEIIGTTCMKLSHGFVHVVPSVVMFSCYALAFACNTFATKTLDLSVTYAVWCGLGTVATAAIGILYFKEAATAVKLISITLIFIGVMGLYTASSMQRNV
jgi:small multidrug resistance pump